MVTFLKPMMEVLPDKRLQRVVPLAVRGILGSESPVVTRIDQTVARTASGVWAAAKRIYRFLDNDRFSHQELAQGLYTISKSNIEQENPPYVVVALNPVNLEKPYATAVEGVSTVYKSTPPQLNGQARLTPVYPAITTTVVNTTIPAVTYAQWFSYTTNFLSENAEIKKPIAATQQLLPQYRIRFVTDAGLDDRKIFAELAADEFVIRASHLERIVEVYNERLDRWERAMLQDLVDVTLFTHTWQVTFTHARQQRQAHINIGWYALRLPQTNQLLWAIIAAEPAMCLFKIWKIWYTTGRRNLRVFKLTYRKSNRMCMDYQKPVPTVVAGRIFVSMGCKGNGS